MGRQKDVLATIEEHLRIRNKLVRQALAECLGTLILVVSGGCSVGMLSNPWLWGKLSWCIVQGLHWNEPSPVQPPARGLEDSACAQEKHSCWGFSQNVGSEELVGWVGASVYL